MFNNIKSAAAKMVINRFLDGIGEVDELEIDKDGKKIVAQVDLAGELQTVRIEVRGYTLAVDHIVLSQFICSRPWVEAALNRFFANKEIKIPAKAMSAIQMVL